MAKRWTKADLLNAIRTVEIKLGEMPPFPTGGEWKELIAAREKWWRDAEQLLQSLESCGAGLSSGSNGTDRRLHFGGVGATSTCGAQSLMHNWLRAARKRLETMEA
jgi:hypothetical protein